MIGGYSFPARNGSVISFNCRYGVLSEQLPSARCDDEGRWNPDPTGLQCIGMYNLCVMCTFYYINFVA